MDLLERTRTRTVRLVRPGQKWHALPVDGPQREGDELCVADQDQKVGAQHWVLDHNTPKQTGRVPAIVVHFNTKVLLGNTKVLLGNTKVLLGNTKVLLGNTRVLLG